jgi:hypothetical protein
MRWAISDSRRSARDHTYAIDATVAETALRQSGPAAVLTSDVDDMTRLCGQHVRLISL